MGGIQAWHNGLPILPIVFFGTSTSILVFSACGRIRTGSKLRRTLLAYGILRKGRLFVTPTLEDCLTRLRAPAKVPKFLFCLNLAPNSAAVFFSCCVRAHRFSDITSPPYVPYQDIPAMVCPGRGVPGNSVPDSGVPGQSVPRPKYSPPFKLIYALGGYFGS